MLMYEEQIQHIEQNYKSRLIKTDTTNMTNTTNLVELRHEYVEAVSTIV